MRIYLLNPPFTPGFGRAARWQSTGRAGALYYPLWLAYATGILEEHFEPVRLVDAPAWGWDGPRVMEDVRAFQPELVVVDSSFGSLSNDVAVAGAIREQVDGVRTVLVGPPASMMADRVLQSGSIDVVARYEYDSTLREVALSVERGDGLEGIPGISYKVGGQAYHNPDRGYLSSSELDRIPFVSRVYRKHLRVKGYFLNHVLFPEVQVFGSRGCPHRCAFCCWPETFMGREYRMRSPSNVVDELEYIREELPQVKEVFFEDDTFTVDKRWVQAICQEIVRRRLRVTWSCNTRANLDYETMGAMKGAGCRLLDVGYESGSDTILKAVKKDITTGRMRQFARDARRAGLLVMGDFVFGLPGETRETAEATLRFARELRPNIVQFAVATPIPGTEFRSWAREGGFLMTDKTEDFLDRDGFQKATVSYPEFSGEDMEEYVGRGLRGYYLSLSYIPVALRTVLRRNMLAELRGLWRSALSFLRYARRGHGARAATGEEKG